MAGDEVHRFTASATWVGDGLGCGNLKLPQGDISFGIGGSRKLGGCGVGANPEEIFLGAVAACFVNTWAIFLVKLKVPYPQPAVRVAGDLGPDPAGGFKLLKTIVYALVPSSLFASHKEQVEKTVSLSEKYCIISKIAKTAMPLEVVIEEI